MTEHRETINKQETAFDGNLFQVAVYEVTLQDGNPARREIVKHPGAVAIVAVDADHNVLLVKQFRTAAQAALYEIPAGTLEPNEDPRDCAIRELREETGYKPLSIEAIGGLYTAPGYTDEYIHLFFTQEITEAPLEQDADEFIEVQRMPLLNALQLIESGEIEDGKTVLGLLRAARRLGV
jgi:ADP-ribose pyrophosphatase